ncbi:EscU/YscU/HrcU family type III secretion system export apparatus switch protein [Marimonas arenosa]|uniref:Flagellar type III secretion system protein FlhB n=1 Tax=Marimonas arenosa TaxID=1795305 RepID=A0AAE3WD81_9RHOB|nr:flagellar type III secretion system protein FlhB [Marimonas arenosa]MDQ2090564.1 flagellar type III secretion system protein FlhB [Marimonas arenosa]
MSQGEDNTDKRHDPTQKKLDDARKKGEIPRSSDLSVAAGYGGLLICALAAGASSIQALGTTMMTMIDQAGSLAPLVFNGDPRAPLGGLASAVVRGALPWFLLPALAVLSVLAAQRGFTFAPTKLRMKLSRIAPVSNAKKKYGRAGLFEFFKSFTKLLVFSAVLGLFLKARLPEMASAVLGGPNYAAVLMAQVSVEFVFVSFLIALAIGGIDFLWQRAEHQRQNRMSDKEMRDEHKEAEGDPHMKNHRRSRAQEIALNQMMSEVPTADVVIVNPAHYAVALTWSRKRGDAPVCVAKGVDEIARKIREVAREAGVPIHADPPTARALYATTELGQEIAPEHFRPVAAAIRFAEAMRRRARRWPQ